MAWLHYKKNLEFKESRKKKFLELLYVLYIHLKQIVITSVKNVNKQISTSQ